MQGDLAAQMVESIDRYLMRETQIVAGKPRTVLETRYLLPPKPI